jgi:hypothetical protein
MKKLILFISFLGYFSSFLKGQDKVPVRQDSAALALVNEYLDVIGGSKKIQEIKTLSIKLTTKVKGTEYFIEKYYKSPDKFAKTLTNKNILVEKWIWDGKKGTVTGIAGTRELSASEIEDIKFEAIPLVERMYGALGFELHDGSIVKLTDGSKIHLIKVIAPNGRTYFEGYDVITGRKVQSLENKRGTTDKPIKIEYINYQQVDGIEFPNTIIYHTKDEIITMLVSLVEINPNIPSDIFVYKPEKIKQKKKEVKKNQINIKKKKEKKEDK